MKKSNRARRAGLAAGIAVTATMAFGASSAQAVPLAADFDDAALKIGILSPFDIIEPPNQSTLDGDINLGTGVITAPHPFVPGAPDQGFFFPTFTGEPLTGVDVTVNLATAAPISGQAGAPGSGIVDTNASLFDVQVTSAALGASCNYQANLQFTTGAGVTIPGGTPAFPGDPFTTLPTDGVNPANGVTVTDGAIQTSWPAGHFPADPSPACTTNGPTLNDLVGGPGSLAIAHGIDLTPVVPVDPATLPTTGGGIVTTPRTDTGSGGKKKKKCKKSKKKGKKGAAAAKCKKKKKKKK